MPPTDPKPDALDQIRSLFSGSGVAQPLSPPPTVNQWPRVIWPVPGKPKSFRVRELLGPHALGPSCRFPHTVYGMRVSVVT